MQGRQFSSINQPSWSQSQSTSTVPSSSPSSHAPYANAYGGLSSALTAPHENYKIAETSLWSDPALKEIDEVANSMDLDLQVRMIRLHRQGKDSLLCSSSLRMDKIDRSPERLLFWTRTSYLAI